MYYNGVPPVISPADLTLIEQAIALIQSKLPFLLQLTADQRHDILKVGDANGRFVEKVCEYAIDKPDYIPGAISSASDLAARREIFLILRRLAGQFTPLAASIEDTTICMGEPLLRVLRLLSLI